MGKLFNFRHRHRDGLHEYVTAAGDDDLPGPKWPGLWQQRFPEDRALSPYFRFGINNNDGEDVAVWRAFAWAITSGRQRVAMPMYYRDEAARSLGVPQQDITLVGWEYDVDVEKSDIASADGGFVPGRTCIRMSPPASRWERVHHDQAGVFAIDSFDELTRIALAVSGDASSEICVFGLRQPQSLERIVAALRRTQRPMLRDVLGDEGVFIDLTVVHDRFCGWTSYLIVRSPVDVGDRVGRLADHFESKFDAYLAGLDSIDSFPEFAAAIDRLLAPPTANL